MTKTIEGLMALVWSYGDECYSSAEGTSAHEAAIRAYAKALVAQEREKDAKLLEQAADALKYHTQMTRPITRTDETISAIRARLSQPPKEPQS